jgi:cell division transport system ATP-binding protein
MILFNGIYKIFPGNITGLENINLKIEDGEFVFLVGPSGAGKSTLLKLIIKETQASSGSIYLDDWEINKLQNSLLPKLRRKVGFVFQDFKLLEDRTASENIAVSLEILGKNRNEISERIKKVLEIIHLENKGNFFPKQLSFGEQQRVAIGRAIAGEAKILLADEPTGNLDPKTSWEILKIITDINKNGTTILMATHNVDIVNSMKKRVITIEKGKIVKDAKKSKYSEVI